MRSVILQSFYIISITTNELSSQDIDVIPASLEKKKVLTEILSALSDLQTTAEKPWSLVLSSLADIRKGLAVTYEVLETFLNNAISTMKNSEVRRQAEEVALAGKELEEHCISRLEQLQDATHESYAQAQELLQIVQHNAIPLHTASRVRIRCDTFEVLLDCCEAFKRNENVTVITESELLHLREIQQKIQKLDDALSHTSREFTMLAQVKEEFLWMQWKLDVRFLIENGANDSVLFTRKLLARGEELGAMIKAPNEYELLKKEIQRTEVFLADLTKLTELVQALMDATGNDMKTLPCSYKDKDAAIEVFDLMDFARDSYFKHLQQAIYRWSEQYTSLSSEILRLQSFLASMKIGKADFPSRLSDLANRISFYHQCSWILQLLSQFAHHEKQVSQSDFCPCSIPGLLIFDQQSKIDFRDLTALLGKLTVLKDADYQYFLDEMLSMMKIIHTAILRWMEKTQTLIPPKNTRTKNRTDGRSPATKEDLIKILHEPISRISHSPAHERIEAVLRDASTFREKLAAFLFPTEKREAKLRNGI